MRKHFLILMLMALLPMAGWAVDFSEAQVVVPDITYGSAVDPSLEAVMIGTYNVTGTSVVEKWTPDEGAHYYAIFYTSAACTTPVKVNVGTPAETYARASQLAANNTYYIKVTNGDYTGFAAGSFNVQKKVLHLTVKNAAGTADWKKTKVWDGLTESEELMDATEFSLEAAEALQAGEVLNPTTNPDETYIFDGSALLMSYTATDANLKADETDFAPARAAHEITFSGLEAANYDVVIANADLFIKQKTIVNGAGNLDGVTITATGMTTTYNNEVQYPVYTVKVGGVTLTPEEFDANFVLSAYTTAARNVAATSKDKGNYFITLAAAETGNFDGSYFGKEAAADLANYQLTINPAVVFVKGKSAGKPYKGSAYKTTETAAALGLDLEYTGLFTGTTIGTNLPTLKIHEDIKDAGKTTIDLTAPASYTNANYTVALDNTGIFEVKKVALTLTAKDKTIVTGTTDPKFSGADVTIADYVESENTEIAKVVSAKFIDGFTLAGKAAGVYPDVIEVTYDTEAAATNVLKNYTVTVAAALGDLTIGNGKIYITANAAGKVYGEDDPATFDYTVVGVAKEDLAGQPVFERENADKQNVGQYKIVLKTPAVAPANYDIEYTTAPVYFTINPAPLTITALPQVIDPAADVAEATDALDQTAVAFDGLQYEDTKANIQYALNVKAGTTVGDNGTYDDAIEFTVPEFANLDARIAWAALPANAGKLNANYDITVVTGDLIVGNTAVTPTIVLPSDKSTLMALLDYYDGQLVNAKVEVKRDRIVAGSNFKWTAKKWNTLVLPFDATIAQISNAFGYAVVNVVDPSNTTINDKGKLSVKFRLEMDDVEANTPFTLKTTAALDDILDANGGYVIFNGVTIEAPETAYPSVDAGLGSTLIGAYEETALNSENPGMFLNNDQWYNISSTSSNNVKIEEFDAYIDKGANAARDFEFVFQELDGSTTSISTVSADNMKSSVAEGWFTVNGIKLNGIPTEKGVYINNGKKVVIK